MKSHINSARSFLSLNWNSFYIVLSPRRRSLLLFLPHCITEEEKPGNPMPQSKCGDGCQRSPLPLHELSWQCTAEGGRRNWMNVGLYTNSGCLIASIFVGLFVCSFEAHEGRNLWMDQAWAIKARKKMGSGAGNGVWLECTPNHWKNSLLSAHFYLHPQFHPTPHWLWNAVFQNKMFFKLRLNIFKFCFPSDFGWKVSSSTLLTKKVDVSTQVSLQPA